MAVKPAVQDHDMGFQRGRRAAEHVKSDTLQYGSKGLGNSLVSSSLLISSLSSLCDCRLTR
eukprot:m.232380 g.232380  ORF g.232380 m.232380 type:complete len:61 (-) comp17373_c0_seq11:1732-1914(-)